MGISEERYTAIAAVARFEPHKPEIQKRPLFDLQALLVVIMLAHKDLVALVEIPSEIVLHGDFGHVEPEMVRSLDMVTNILVNFWNGFWRDAFLEGVAALWKIGVWIGIGWLRSLGVRRLRKPTSLCG